jgi:hypothetical protein
MVFNPNIWLLKSGVILGTCEENKSGRNLEVFGCSSCHNTYALMGSA